jgi:hypothetical protein
MAKSPDDRYASMREFDAALAEFDQTPRSQERQSLYPSWGAPAQPEPRNLRARLLRLYASRAPQLAQLRLWLLSIASASFVFAGLLALCAGALRSWHGGAPLTLGEMLLCALASAALTSVPGIAWANYVFWHVSLSTARVIEISARCQRVLAASAGSYAAGMLFVRLLGALGERPSRSAWLGWDLLVFPFALSMGAAVAWLELRSRRQ